MALLRFYLLQSRIYIIANLFSQKLYPRVELFEFIIFRFFNFILKLFSVQFKIIRLYNGKNVTF